MMAVPKIGLFEDETHGNNQEEKGNRKILQGKTLPVRGLLEEFGQGDDEGDLHEFGGLERERADPDPPLGP